MSALTLGTALVDVSALEGFPHRARALNGMHRQIDRHFAIRQIMGVNVTPPECQVCPLGNGLILLVKIEAER